MAGNARFVLDPDWVKVVHTAAEPTLHKMAQDAKDYIDSPPEGKGIDAGGCPVETGNMRNNSFAWVGIEDGEDAVMLGVNLDNAPYALYMITGTGNRGADEKGSNVRANHYLERAMKHALDNLRSDQR